LNGPELQIRRALEHKSIVEPKIKIFKSKNHLKKQTALLCSMEAKLPPHDKINNKIFSRWNEWVSSTLAILVGLETWIEDGIKIHKPVKNIIKEKADTLKQIEAKYGFDQPQKTKQWKKAVIEWLAASKL